MRSRVIIFIAFVMAGYYVHAQDIIEMSDGSKVEAKIIEVTDKEVVYKKSSNPDGPSYRASLTSISMITYKNGEVESYGQKTSADTVKKVTTSTAPLATIPVSNSFPASDRMGFIMYMPSELAYWSFYTGIMKKNFGWFLGFRSDFFGLSDPIDYLYEASSEMQSELSDNGYAGAGQTTEEKTSFTLGMMFAPGEDWLFLYAGAGFGMYNQYDLYDKYLYDYTLGAWEWDSKVWLKNADESIMGVEFEGGLLFDVGPVLSAGFTSTNFQHFKWTMGIGFKFREKERKKRNK